MRYAITANCPMCGCSCTWHTQQQDDHLRCSACNGTVLILTDANLIFETLPLRLPIKAGPSSPSTTPSEQPSRKLTEAR
jgi:hypothetical protein